MPEYARTKAIVANLPYTVMVATGAANLAWGFDFSAGALVVAACYLAYSVAGALWIMIFICRYCGYYDTRGCPCGYGVLAAKLVRKGEQERFAAQFKRHIPVIVPLWLIPVACGAFALSRAYSNGLAGLLVVFAINSFVILPLVSRRHACSECPQKERCPWMAQRKNVT